MDVRGADTLILGPPVRFRARSAGVERAEEDRSEVVLAAWLSKNVNSLWLAAGLGLILIGVAIHGLVNNDMPTIIATLIMVTGVINLIRRPPPAEEPVTE